MSDQKPGLETALPEVDESSRKTLLQRMNPINLLRKESPQTLIKEADQLTERRNYAQAGLLYQKAIEMEPEFTPSYIAFAAMLVKKGGSSNLKEALKQLQAASYLNPLNEEIYAHTAKLYNHLKMPKEEALEKKKVMVVKTLEEDPTNPVANNNMGILMLQQGFFPKAIEYFRKALQGNPKYDVAYRNMAMASYKAVAETEDPDKKKEHAEKGREYIEKALAIHPENVASLTIMARFLIMEQKHQEALAVLDKAEKYDPVYKEIFLLRKGIYMHLQMAEEAIKASELYNSLDAHDRNKG